MTNIHARFKRYGAALTGLAALCFVAVLPAQDVGSISGIVLKRGTTEAISDVQVTLSGPVERSAISSSRGEFAFGGVPPGEYTIRLNRSEFFGPYINGTAQRQALLTFFVAAGQKLQLVGELTPGSAIGGRVVNSRGDGVAGAPVTVYRATYYRDRRYFSHSGEFKADDKGNYRAFWFAPGEYFLRAELPKPSPVVPPSNSDIVPTYFPDESFPERALPVRVGAGADVVDNNIRLQTTKTYKVSINTPPVAPVEMRVIYTYHLLPRGANLTIGPSSTISSSLEFSGLLPGRYTLYAVQETVERLRLQVAQKAYARADIDVIDRDIKAPPLTFAQGVPIQVHLTISGNPGLINSVQLQLVAPREVPFYAPPIKMGNERAAAISDVPEGVYSIDVFGFPGYVADLRHNGRTVYEQGLIEIGNRPSNLEVVVCMGGATVSGRAEIRGPAESNGAAVVLIPERGVQNTSLYKRTQSEKNGVFSITNIAPGAYRMFAFTNLPPGAEQNSDFMRVYQNAGVALTISDGQTIVANLPTIVR